MANPDIFGNSKDIKTPGAIMTAEYAALNISGGVSLVQSVQASYSRQLNTMFEAGSSTVFYMQGASEGKIEASAAVGKAGFFQNLKTGDGCGEIKGVAITAKGKGCFTGAGTVNFNGALAESFNIAYKAGPEAVVNGIGIRVGSMSVS